jgi:hypothetical protein
VTNGLLVNELITGQVQTGVDEFIPLNPANISIAGDSDNDFPTYASLSRIYNTPAGRALGDHVTGMFLRADELPQYADDAATEIVRVERGFGIPRAFWDYMNRTGTIYRNGQLAPDQPIFDWLFTLGYPTTEAFWARVRVGGVEREVMFQAFERRLLTYTPSNPQPFQVEMGNVGRHYYQWRYEDPFAGDAEAGQPSAAGAGLRQRQRLRGRDRRAAEEHRHRCGAGEHPYPGHAGRRRPAWPIRGDVELYAAGAANARDDRGRHPLAARRLGDRSSRAQRK